MHCTKTEELIPIKGSKYMRLTSLPNILTLIRISLIPILILFFYLPFKWSYLVTAIIFAFAAITDWLDGFLARKLSLESPLGEFLDPVADKLIVAVALALLIQSHSTVLLTIPAIIIICREIVISALREWMAELGKRANVKVSILGKIKTIIQMLAITILLAQSSIKFNLDNLFLLIGYITLYLAVILTLWSMFIYLKAAWNDLITE